MHQETTGPAALQDAPDEELIDVLTAISVVAKRLAVKLRNEIPGKGEKGYGKNE